MSLNNSNLAIDIPEYTYEDTINLQEVKKESLLYIALKKVIDIFAGIIGTILLVPILLVTIVLRMVNKENRGPIFYTQQRIGKNGKEFKLYKLRTMCVGADATLEKYLNKNEEAKKEYSKYKKLKNDPRITKTGKFLRTTSLDEFPQFINILKGDMSLVGPRPYLVKEKNEINYYNEIIQCRPGITGYWQVNGRNNTQFSVRNDMDKLYVENKSLKMDIKIIFKTISNIAKKDGAM